MELRQIGSKTYYIEHDTNIGIYMTGPESVCLIDTGSAGDGEKIDGILSERGWKIDFIINTHTHIDHIGGNKYLMEKYGVPAYCTDVDRAFADYPDLEAYMAKRSFGYLVDAGEYLNTLEMLKGLGGRMFVPSHGIAEEDIGGVLDMNITNQRRLIEAVRDICGSGFHSGCDGNGGAGLDCIVKKMYEFTGMKNNAANHALLSSTVKCYLTYMQDRGELECGFEDNVMVWKSIFS